MQTCTFHNAASNMKHVRVPCVVGFIYSYAVAAQYCTTVSGRDIEVATAGSSFNTLQYTQLTVSCTNPNHNLEYPLE